MPVLDGRRPVIRLARDGLHSGAWQWALANSVPRAASASMCGVFACGCPLRQPTQSFWSSIAMNRTFGLAGEAAAAAAAAFAAAERVTARQATTASRTVGIVERRFMVL